MVSFADNIANGITNISANFDRQIMGQANRIAQLQGAGGAAGAAGAGGAGTPGQQVQAALMSGDKGQIKQALDAIRQDPKLLQAVPPELREKVAQAAFGPQGAPKCCGCG